MEESEYVFDSAIDDGGSREVESKAKKALLAPMRKIFQTFPKVSPFIIQLWSHGDGPDANLLTSRPW